MPPKPKSATPVLATKHKDKRANIPTEELRDFVADDEKAPKNIPIGLTFSHAPQTQIRHPRPRHQAQGQARQHPYRGTARLRGRRRESAEEYSDRIDIFPCPPNPNPPPPSSPPSTRTSAPTSLPRNCATSWPTTRKRRRIFRSD